MKFFKHMNKYNKFDDFWQYFMQDIHKNQLLRALRKRFYKNGNYIFHYYADILHGNFAA